MNDLTFIETQFPVSKLSKESYVERKGHLSQTLTSLGKWWGRKPLIMVRAAILGLLMPASDDPRADREAFLKLLTMDEEGLWHRKSKNLPLKDLYPRLSPEERLQWFGPDADPGRPRLKKGTKAEERQQLQRLVFERLGYDEKLVYCDRPEQIDGPSQAAWQAINAHLGTRAASLPQLVRELGERRFGHIPRVGDAFCGGGSVPFEAARLGCEAYGSDLNPVAALLTWAALNIVGGGEEVAERVRAAQQAVYDAVDRQITDWRIEHNALGWRADAYLYCTETRCPDCGWMVPMAPSWVIGEKNHAVALLVPDPAAERFDIQIRQGVTKAELEGAKAAGTVRASRLECPNPIHRSDQRGSNPMTQIRGDRRTDGETRYGLRMWENEDLVPRPDDVLQERLYCVRWRLPSLEDLLWAEQRERAGKPFRRPVPDYVPIADAIAGVSEFLSPGAVRDLDALRARDWLAEDERLERLSAELQRLTKSAADKKERGKAQKAYTAQRAAIAGRNVAAKSLSDGLPGSVYRAVDADDLEREERILGLLVERFEAWQENGYIPSRRIERGDKTDEPIRTRGWTHWHHLFTSRQLLTHGTIASNNRGDSRATTEVVDLLLSMGRAANWDSKLCQWGTGAARESISQSFYNQAFNTLSNFPSKALRLLWNNFGIVHESIRCPGLGHVGSEDARTIRQTRDFWLTDPPYADAINYHELSEFFLAWYEKHLAKLFPDWNADSKRALAIRGSGKDFRQGMVDAYRNLAAHMPDNGLQIVMFTHQDAGVWADLALILWAAGLRVTAAWTIATETESALKEGNYVQGTVLMVLRKQDSDEVAFIDELVPEVESEVERQLDVMLALDDKEDPNFSDADYQLAAYAAALRVITRYGNIEDIDVAYELSRERSKGEESPLARVIKDAVRTASNYLVPPGLPEHLWKRLGPEEKLYLKGLEVEGHGELRSGVYQEFARGFGVRDYRFMLRTGKANETRLKTASELKRKELGDSPFGHSLVRHALYAIWRAAESGDTRDSLTWLRTEAPAYWDNRETLVAILRYLSKVEIPHWATDADAARIVAGAVDNDHV